MFKSIRKSKLSKMVACYLAVQLVATIIAPTAAYALTSGPSQPEFNSFTPIGTSDMVNLSSGDFNYNIPIMDVGGYPLNLAYDSGITMDQEASWVGLGWNLNVGQINRQVRGLPDDFDGDEMTYVNSVRDNNTVGMTLRVNPQLLGVEGEGLEGSFGLGIQYNNYEGVSFKPSYGLSFDISDNVTVGLDVTTSATEGVSVSPNVSLHDKMENAKNTSLNGITGKLGLGSSFNSRQGLTVLNLSTSVSKKFSGAKIGKRTNTYNIGAGGSGYISFINNTFTPSKRNSYLNQNITFSASLGLDFWGIDAEVGVDAYGTRQTLLNNGEDVLEKAYGYEYTHNASAQDILDFNKEKDQTVSENTLIIPPTNYTYDTYSINGQGIGGMFRPFKGQVDYVYDQLVQDQSYSSSFGGEVEGASGFHIGANLELSPSESHTGSWSTNATSYFKPAISSQNELDYEPVYFKTIGEMRVDDESELFYNTLGGHSAIAVSLNDAPSDAYGRFGSNSFTKKEYSTDASNFGATLYTKIPKNASGQFTGFPTRLKRTNRERRNRSITKFTNDEVTKLGVNSLIKANDNAKPWHTAGMHILQPDGATYVYGETAYNNHKEEVTFAQDTDGDCTTGLIDYSGLDNSKNNSKGLDNYFNKITTPEYAHTYLLTGVLSSDYEDITGNGLTDDDLGSYTKFTYKTVDNSFKWRTPFQLNKASYDEGLKTNRLDDKGSYVYGEKELKYIQKIETKTHVAIFRLLDRDDSRGVIGHNGGVNSLSGRTKKLDKIYLFSKPEYTPQIANLLEDDNPNNDPSEAELMKSTIKIAHFDYTYDLCPQVPNNATGQGKLTLSKVYFTYRNSYMGRYTPYVFNYGDFNPAYNLKGYDIWGNYKPNIGDCNTQGSNITTAEFPFVAQGQRETQDMYAGAWSLKSIDLPSGGKLNVSYETDDYQFVQDRRAMQMFKIAGVTKEDNIPSSDDFLSPNRNKLFNPDNYDEDARYLIVEIPEPEESVFSFRNKYLGSQENEPIYYRFLMNMVVGESQSYDYVSGYFEIDTDASMSGNSNNRNHRYYTFSDDGKYYGAIRLKFSDVEGGINPNRNVNPIAKSSWYFARRYLNRQAYGLPFNPGSENVGDIAQSLGASIGAISEIFDGPNVTLRNKQCGRLFNPDKSWIRLQHSGNQKLGGGVRVKKIELDDQWDVMLGESPSEEYLKYYKSQYGQEYDYNFEDGKSSGVATYEPNGSKENPFIQPFYNKGERLIAPREVSYVEKPFGESFFPSPTVTYRQVTVKNLVKENEGIVLEKHATGKVVSSFFTSYDFPTKTDYTALDRGFASNENAVGESVLLGLIGGKVKTRTELALSQGFLVETNDMNGRDRSQKVYSESGALVSGVDYNYFQKPDGSLENKVPVIYKDGSISEDKEIGTHYDVVTDFRESYSRVKSFGINTNVASFAIPFIPPFIVIPTSLPARSEHTKTLHTSSTTKVIHSSGILKEKIAYDLGARVSTENVAWDAESGEILLTKTVNEYNDQYYNFTYPAHWHYDGMDKASKNIGIEGSLQWSNVDQEVGNREFFTYSPKGNENAEDVFALGDELYTGATRVSTLEIVPATVERLWVVALDGNTVTLMNRDGKVINQSCSNITKEFDLYFKIIRSGYRNQHTASMASVTSQVNPIDLNGDNVLNPILIDTFRYYDKNGNLDPSKNPKIINASAVVYKNFWKPQRESGLPQLPTSILGVFNSLNSLVSPAYLEPIVPPENYGFNPYVFNVKGDWRAVNSYAYLTGRQRINQDATKIAPRQEGFFSNFIPFYTLGDALGGLSNSWTKNDERWTFASKVSQYSPYGAELENKDALDRFSSAQYGYDYTLPTAVASNSSYAQMGYDGFEDYFYNGVDVVEDEGHFNLSASPDLLTDNESHTGRYSIKVPGGSQVSLSTNLSSNDHEVEQPEDCSPPPPLDPVSINVNETVCDCVPGDPDDNDAQVNIFRYQQHCDRVSELDLSSIPDGQTVTLVFNWSVSVGAVTNNESGSASISISGELNEQVSSSGSDQGSSRDGQITLVLSNLDTIIITSSTDSGGESNSPNGASVGACLDFVSGNITGTSIPANVGNIACSSQNVSCDY